MVGGPAVLAAWLAPNLTLLGGFAEPGRLRPERVQLYNAVHRFAGPALVSVVGVVTEPMLLALGLVWLSHVMIDRTAGYGLRAADGWQG